MVKESNDEQRKQQEMIMKFQIFEQQIQAIQQQLQAVEQAMMDITELNRGLDELVGKTGKEILAPLGRGVFAKAKLISEDLVVDIGGKNFVGKSIPDTKKIIEEQIVKLEDIRKQLNAEMEKINTELTRVFMEAQKSQGKYSAMNPDLHEHENDCECGEDCDCDDADCHCGHNH